MPLFAGSETATVTARDRDGDADSVSFRWTVTADLKPAFAGATLTNRDWNEGQAINAFTLPASTGGDGSLKQFHSGAVAQGTDRETGRSRGFGFVDMPNQAEATVAIAYLNGRDFGGRGLRVNEARPGERR